MLTLWTILNVIDQELPAWVSFLFCTLKSYLAENWFQFSDNFTEAVLQEIHILFIAAHTLLLLFVFNVTFKFC